MPSLCERRSTPNRGVTLIEALLATTIAAMASAALLTALEASLSTATDATDRTIAEGLAQQQLDEICQQRFVEPGVSPLSTAFGTESGESGSAGRSGFDDSDDYHGHSQSPLQGVYGETLGTGNDAGGLRSENFRLPSTYFGRWRRTVSVYFVNADTLQKLTSGTSYFRCIEVTVEQKDSSGAFLPLATKRRVIAYVPPTSS